MQQFVRFEVNGSVQPILFIVESDHLVNRNVIWIPAEFRS